MTAGNRAAAHGVTSLSAWPRRSAQELRIIHDGCERKSTVCTKREPFAQQIDAASSFVSNPTRTLDGCRGNCATPHPASPD